MSASMALKARFIAEVENLQQPPRMVAVAVQLPTGALETIVNYQEVQSKIDYYWDAYDEDFRLKTNRAVQIVGYMLV